MPTWLKVLLIVMLVGVMIVVGIGVAGYFWVKKNMKDFDPQKATAEGKAFGAGKTVQQCFDEGMARLSTNCDSLACQAKARIFFESCAQVAAPSPALCEGAPGRSEIIKSAQWAAERCDKIGRKGDSKCTSLMAAVVPHCP
jgi:hypothetical protein